MSERRRLGLGIARPDASSQLTLSSFVTRGFIMPKGASVPKSRFALASILVVGGVFAGVPAAALTLQEALQVAEGTTRARVAQGDLDIAKQNHRARRIRFYFPTVSINGAVPSYAVDESYRFFGGSSRKRLYQTTDLSFTSFVKLEQALVTGGNLEIRANLASLKNRYPDTDPSAPTGSFLDERTRRGFFDFILRQPILKPSESRNELAATADELDLARLVRVEEETTLRTDVTTAYLDLLIAELDRDLAATRLESARIKAEIDSTKWQDAVLSQEDWLASKLARLDAELAHRANEARVLDQQRELAMLLDADPAEPIPVSEPAIAGHPSEAQQTRWIEGWDRALPIRQAQVAFEKARREARLAAAGKGFSGDVEASYSSGHSRVKLEDLAEEPIDTRGWGIALNVSYPLWDGGAVKAAARAAQLSVERAELELARAKQDARAEILRLTNEVSVGYRRLDVQRSQVEIAAEAVAIAQSRMEDGRLSRTGWLDTRVLLLETRSKYLTELKTYLLNRIALEGQFAEVES
jgi:outer membrane protein TolC